MNKPDITREEMWAKQQISPDEVDYSGWEKEKMMLRRMAETGHSCIFVVDVCKGRYSFASSGFSGWPGYDSQKIEKIGQHADDYLESRIHPDDLEQMKSMQVSLSRFIYNQPETERNHYKNIFTYRMLNAKRRYVNVTSRHHVLRTTRNGKAWLIAGILDIASCQHPLRHVECSVQNLKTGELFSPLLLSENKPDLTLRETGILQLIKQGLLSKEIAFRLGISIHTVNIHRQNIFRKLDVQNAIEAVNLGSEKGLII